MAVSRKNAVVSHRTRWLGSPDEHTYLPRHRPRRLRRARRGATRRAPCPHVRARRAARRFHPEGHLSYDLAARPAFTFRFLDSGEAEEDILEATERAETAAEAWLTERGYGYKNLRSKAEDLSQAPLGKRQRRAAAHGS